MPFIAVIGVQFYVRQSCTPNSKPPPLPLPILYCIGMGVVVLSLYQFSGLFLNCSQFEAIEVLFEGCFIWPTCLGFGDILRGFPFAATVSLPGLPCRLHSCIVVSVPFVLSFALALVCLVPLVIVFLVPGGFQFFLQGVPLAVFLYLISFMSLHRSSWQKRPASTLLFLGELVSQRPHALNQDSVNQPTGGLPPGADHLGRVVPTSTNQPTGGVSTPTNQPAGEIPPAGRVPIPTNQPAGGVPTPTNQDTGGLPTLPNQPATGGVQTPTIQPAAVVHSSPPSLLTTEAMSQLANAVSTAVISGLKDVLNPVRQNILSNLTEQSIAVSSTPSAADAVQHCQYRLARSCRFR